MQSRLSGECIIFPEHKTPSIAGADAKVEDFKIDLSKLFGANGSGDGGRKRDTELVADGREAVGSRLDFQSVKLASPKSRATALDDLMDGLDSLDPVVLRSDGEILTNATSRLERGYQNAGECPFGRGIVIRSLGR